MKRLWTNKTAENRRFVITGGPGTGKSMLIAALRRAGFSCFDEVSRQVIRRASQQGTDHTPWQNLGAFADECSRQMVQQLSVTDRCGCYFFDRGIPDVIAYLRCGGMQPSGSMLEAGRGYASVVFLAPPWPDIFVNDSERPQSFADCVSIHNELIRAYSQLNYRLVLLPKASVEERKHFVLNYLQECGSIECNEYKYTAVNE